MPGRTWWPLAVIVTGLFMLLVDVTIVNVALPQIGNSLGASFTELQWVIDAYALVLATFMLTAGALADLYGRKGIFVGGLAVFTAASIVCGLSTSPLFLILARALQGIGGAALFATSLALIAQSYRGRERGIAFGVWGAVAGAAVAIGPMLGGLITTGIGWEWIFFVNGPIGAVAIVGAVLVLEESSDPDAARLDWIGLVTFAGGVFLVVLALLRGNDHGWGSAQTVGALAGGAVLLAAFVVAQVREERPMVDLGLFRRRAFVGTQTTAFLLSCSYFGLFLYLALYLQNVLGYSALGAGLRLLPISLCAFLVAPVAGRLSASVPVRLLIGAGMGLIAASMLLMEGLSAADGWTALLAGFVVGGLGLGLTNPPLASTAISVAPRERSGMASGINNTFRQLGLATGVAALGAVFQARIHSHLTDALAGTPAAAHVGDLAKAASSGSVAQALGSVPPAAREQVAAAAREAFVSSLNGLFWISAVLAALGAVLALVLVRQDEVDSHAEPHAAPSAEENRDDVPVAAK